MHKLLLAIILAISIWAGQTLNNGGSSAWDYYSIKLDTPHTNQNYTLIRVD